MRPGAMAFTVIACGASWIAIVRDHECSADFAAQLAFNPGAKTSAGSWGNYLYARNSLLSTFAPYTHVVFVSGDIHSGGAIDNGTNSGRPELNIPHTNVVTGCVDDNAYDTGCPQLGTWTRNAGEANCYVSGDPTGHPSQCTNFTFPAGGPGYGLITYNSATKQLTLEVKDQAGVTRTNPNLPTGNQLMKLILNP